MQIGEMFRDLKRYLGLEQRRPTALRLRAVWLVLQLAGRGDEALRQYGMVMDDKRVSVSPLLLPMAARLYVERSVARP